MPECLDPSQRNDQEHNFDDGERGKLERFGASEYEDAGDRRSRDDPKQCSAKEIRSQDQSIGKHFD